MAPEAETKEPVSKAARCDKKDGEGETPLELMAKRNKGMHSERSVAVGRSFTPRPTDVFVTTYPKCGTTWMTQICHQLRTGGHMDFEEITQVCPWDILAFDCGQDLDADHVANPRVFKSHERAGDIAKGAKYIHVCRDPEDAFISFRRFLPAWAALPPDSITAEEFAQAVFGGVSHSGGIWDFYVEWWERRHDPNVLWICYEDLRSDFRGQIRRIAKFMDVPLSDELLQSVEELSSFKYMESKSKQFDDHWLFGKVRDQMHIPSDYVFGDVAVSKVRAGGGTVGEGTKGLPPAVLKMLRDRWEISVKAKIGFASYADLRKAVSEL
eukprot:TRINITY_DN13677_c0_g1_i1.p1 TRINITY_DN13677_c0_g1~~TRINITY_DN13677_c0_g1_i1.p1  ORF type:complete len:325 (-),score=60.20 TRINITY_DN13677_c0_g1_i1:195-1169(-)